MFLDILTLLLGGLGGCVSLATTTGVGLSDYQTTHFIQLALSPISTSL
jgi:hypothetical protein